MQNLPPDPKKYNDFGNIASPGQAAAQGTIDGGTYKISNLTLDANANFVGLFGYISGGTVKNLTLENFSVTKAFYNIGTATGLLTLLMLRNLKQRHC